MVTGSCYLLEYQNSKFLVDCGLFQGNKLIKEHNYGAFPFNVTDIDFVLLTHAHIDHSGLLPKLAKHGYRGPIYTTEATIALAGIMLPDSGYIQEMEIERKNRKLLRAGEAPLTPIYTADDARAMQSLFVEKKYGESFSPAEGLSVTFRDAGHILGSAMLEICYDEERAYKLMFTGDLGRSDQAIINNPFIAEDCDFLVSESTYGNRLHGGGFEEEKPRFAQLINQTIQMGGNVVIPAFAVDRTQDILMMLYEMIREKRISAYPIYVDSPLAILATEIFAAHPQYFDEETVQRFKEEGKAPFLLDNLTYTRTAEESMRLNGVKGAIIISASGMADSGRIKHHLKHNLWRKESAIVFCGFQAEGTLGHRLLAGEPKVTIHGEEIDVKARIFNMDGFSAHADYEEILDWLGNFKKFPAQIIITHGNEENAFALSKRISDCYAVSTVVPQMGETLLLDQSRVQLTPQADFPAIISGEELWQEINLDLEKIAAAEDAEKLLRLRNFLRQLG